MLGSAAIWLMQGLWKDRVCFFCVCLTAVSSAQRRKVEARGKYPVTVEMWETGLYINMHSKVTSTKSVFRFLQPVTRHSRGLSSRSAGVIPSQQTQSVSLLLNPRRSFHFHSRLQLMRLFPGFLLFFKDARQRRSCRISHQSPPPPALCLVSHSFTFANTMKQCESGVHAVCFSCFRWKNIAEVWNKSYSWVFQSSLPRGWRPIRVHTRQTLPPVRVITFSCDTQLPGVAALQSVALWDMTNAFPEPCLIRSSFWHVSKTLWNVSWACPQLVSTWLANWYLPPCYTYRWSISSPSCSFAVYHWISSCSMQM